MKRDNDYVFVHTTQIIFPKKEKKYNNNTPKHAVPELEVDGLFD